MAVFQASELLVPRAELLENWAVIACDQFTSQPDYWRKVRERVGEEPSAYHIIFPEAELGGDTSGASRPSMTICAATLTGMSSRLTPTPSSMWSARCSTALSAGAWWA